MHAHNNASIDQDPYMSFFIHHTRPFGDGVYIVLYFVLLTAVADTLPIRVTSGTYVCAR
jgi:hypothetical protein